MDSREEYIHIFELADKNHSGVVSYEELLQQMKAFGYKNLDSSFRDFFSQHGKGQFTVDDFIASMGKAPIEIHRAAYLRRVFKAFDRDNNNKLDKKELQNATAALGEQLTKEEIEVLMMIMDKNMNNYIDLEEFIYAANTLHKAVQ